MDECERCGSVIGEKNQFVEPFKCLACKDIKFKRDLLKPILDQVRLNFKKGKQSKHGFILDHLYLYGSFADVKPECGDIDILITHNQQKIEDYIEDKQRDYRDELFISCFDVDADKFDIPRLINFLEENDFWDFRKCNDYPFCLDDCCEQFPNCHSFKDSKIHRYCLERCKVKEKVILPQCCYGYECKMHKSMYKEEVSTFLRGPLYDIIKKQVDILFNHSNLEIKVLHLSGAASIQDFQDIRKGLRFKFIILE